MILETHRYIMAVDRNLVVIVFCALTAFAILYEPQPILPLLADQWGETPARVSLLVSVCLLVLGIAPLVYGYVLELVSARGLLLVGFAVLASAQVGLSMGPGYEGFLALRSVQALVLPAILTALMTYVSGNQAPERVRHAMGVYIAATILGGFSGRSVTGLVTDLASWQVAFALWAVMALLALVAARGLSADMRAGLGQVKLRDFANILTQPLFRTAYVVVFLMFFIFAAMLNFLPFRMRELAPDVSGTAIAMVYAGYLVGIALSLGSRSIRERLGGETRTLKIAVVIYLAGTLMFAVPWLPMAYPSMFVFAAGMFLIHSQLSGLLNHIAESRKGLVNGLYVSSYYAGGALGAFAPGFVYQYFGWPVFIALLVVAIGALALFTWRLN